MSAVSKIKYEPPILACKETAENGEWSKERNRSCSKEVTSQLNYATIKVSSDWKKIYGKKQNNFISFFILLK